MIEVLSLLLDRLLQWMPSLLLKIFLKPEKLAAQVLIRLREERPIVLALTSEVRYLDLYLDITNHSPLLLTLDRLLIDMWFGQPTFTGAVLRRARIRPRETSFSVFHREFLTTGQRDQIDRFLASKEAKGRLMIHLTAYLDSKIGVIEVRRDVDREAP